MYIKYLAFVSTDEQIVFRGEKESENIYVTNTDIHIFTISWEHEEILFSNLESSIASYRLLNRILQGFFFENCKSQKDVIWN